jgi:hypothetical protein
VSCACKEAICACRALILFSMLDWAGVGDVGVVVTACPLDAAWAVVVVAGGTVVVVTEVGVVVEGLDVPGARVVAVVDRGPFEPRPCAAEDCVVDVEPLPCDGAALATVVEVDSPPLSAADGDPPHPARAAASDTRPRHAAIIRPPLERPAGQR